MRTTGVRGSRTIQGSGNESSRPVQKKGSASEGARASEKRNGVCVDDPAESRS